MIANTIKKTNRPLSKVPPLPQMSVLFFESRMFCSLSLLRVNKALNL